MALKLRTAGSNWTGILIDIRAENAHVVAPPSIHQNRQKYEWIEGGLNTLSNIDENVEVLLRMIKRNQIKEDIYNED